LTCGYARKTAPAVRSKDAAAAAAVEEKTLLRGNRPNLGTAAAAKDAPRSAACSIGAWF
jgi:hypothetical protein